MTPQGLTRRLNEGQWGRWSGVIGPGWPALVRVLHPAALQTGAGLADVRWSALPGARGRDLSTASWHDVSGVRLHQGRTTAGWDAEPAVGPDDRVARDLLSLLAHPQEQLWVGRWMGRSGRRAGGDRLPVATVQGVAREYEAELVRTEDLLEAGWPRDEQDLVWSVSGRWLWAADIDLPCTLVGCDEAVASALLSAPELEAMPVCEQDRAVT